MAVQEIKVGHIGMFRIRGYRYGPRVLPQTDATEIDTGHNRRGRRVDDSQLAVGRADIGPLAVGGKCYPPGTSSDPDRPSYPVGSGAEHSDPNVSNGLAARKTLVHS